MTTNHPPGLQSTLAAMDRAGELPSDVLKRMDEQAAQRRAEIRAFDTHAIPMADPRKVQLLALFDRMDERGKNLIMRFAAINAEWGSK